MSDETFQFNDEKAKHDIINDFWDELKLLLEKKVLSRRNGRTKFKWVKSASSHSKYGIKNECVMTNGNKKLSFTVEVYPWIWSNNEVFVLFALKDTQKLAVPSKFVLPKSKGAVWKGGYNVFFFLTNTESVLRYIQVLELTPLDVGLFKTIQTAVEKLIGK